MNSSQSPLPDRPDPEAFKQFMQQMDNRMERLERRVQYLQRVAMLKTRSRKQLRMAHSEDKHARPKPD